MYIIIDKIKIIFLPINLLNNNQIQIPRSFRNKSADNAIYRKGFKLSLVECEGTLGERCVEFKSFADGMNYKIDNLINSFLYQILRFACACLNKRQNGTCYFGVADDGKIVGLNIDDLDLKSKFTDALKNENGILKYFHPYVAKRAQECIHNPKFIKVLNFEGKNLYVMEIDVEPLSIFCENKYFKINLSKRKKRHNKNKNHYSIFIRSGSKTIRLEQFEEEEFIKNELPIFVAFRESFKQNELKTCFNPDAQHGCVSCNSKCITLYSREACKSGICISCKHHDTYFLIIITALTILIFLRIFFII